VSSLLVMISYKLKFRKKSIYPKRLSLG
ncbi:hypothetical protein CP061683_0316B, partial [Chlamydia psittaci 06-1683]